MSHKQGTERSDATFLVLNWSDLVKLLTINKRILILDLESNDISKKIILASYVIFWCLNDWQIICFDYQI